MTLPAAPPPVFTWFAFVRRSAGWILAVWGCALPLFIITWPMATPGGLAGEAAGVAVWTMAVVARDEQLRRRGSIVAWRPLRLGAAILLVMQLVMLTLFDPLFFAFLYAPALLLMSRLRLIPDHASIFFGNLLLTLVCGGQALVWALALGHLARLARPLIAGVGRRAPGGPG
jgi:hypothetical protein